MNKPKATLRGSKGSADRIALLRKALERSWRAECLCQTKHGKPCDLKDAELFSIGGMVQRKQAEIFGGSYRAATDAMVHIATVLLFTQDRRCISLWEDEPGREWREVEALLLATEHVIRTGKIKRMSNALTSDWDLALSRQYGRAALHRFFVEVTKAANERVAA